MVQAMCPMRIPEFAEFMGLEPKTIYNWIYLGKAPKITRVGRRVYFRWEDAQRWMDERAEEKGGKRK